MDDYNKLQPVCGLNLGLHIKKKKIIKMQGYVIKMYR